jgi:hypothetical protein
MDSEERTLITLCVRCHLRVHRGGGSVTWCRPCWCSSGPSCMARRQCNCHCPLKRHPRRGAKES